MSISSPPNDGTKRLWWAYAVDFPAGADDWAEEATKVAPTSDMLQYGWHGNMQLPAEIENYMVNSICSWMNHLHAQSSYRNFHFVSVHDVASMGGATRKGVYDPYTDSFAFFQYDGHMYTSATQNGFYVVVAPTGYGYFNTTNTVAPNLEATAYLSGFCVSRDSGSYKGYYYCCGDYANDTAYVKSTFDGTWGAISFTGTAAKYLKCISTQRPSVPVYFFGEAGAWAKGTGGTSATRQTDITSFGDVVDVAIYDDAEDAVVVTDGLQIAYMDDNNYDVWSVSSVSIGTLLTVCKDPNSTGLLGVLSTGEFATATRSGNSFTWTEQTGKLEWPSWYLGADALTIIARDDIIVIGDLGHPIGWISTDRGLTFELIRAPLNYYCVPVMSRWQIGIATQDSAGDPVMLVSQYPHRHTDGWT